MIDDTDIPATLRRSREALGISLADWARMVKSTKSYLSMVETGQRTAPDWLIEAYELTSRSVLMKRRTVIAALAAVPSIAAATETLAPETAERALAHGLYLGNQGALDEAHHMYGLATMLADWTGHGPTRGYIRARTATRGIYEGWTKARAMEAVNQALRISQESRVVVEAHAALVQVHALAGDVVSGRGAVEAMERASETEADHIRTAVFKNYLECMRGDQPHRASRILDRYRTELEADRVWHHEALVYQGLAMVRAGDRSGVTMALEAVQSLGVDVRMVGMAVQHLLDEVTFEADEIDELRAFARV